MADCQLELRDVSAGYDGAAVLDGVSLRIPAGGSLAVLGRNGAGKSTLLLTIMGFTRVVCGSVSWCGAEMTHLQPHCRARRGLGWIPQARGIFQSLTVNENLHAVARPGHWNAASVYGLFPGLSGLRDRKGGNLSGGERQMLTIARTLMTNPELLLLDEPSEGLAPSVVEQLVDALRLAMAETAMGLILVEHHVAMALSLSREALVLERGAIAFHGLSADLRNDSQRLDALLGLNPALQGN